MDKKFSVGDASSDAYRDSWERMFGEKKPELICPVCGEDHKRENCQLGVDVD